MNNLIESICEDNKVRYTQVGDSHFFVQRKNGYILFRELKLNLSSAVLGLLER